MNFVSVTCLDGSRLCFDRELLVTVREVATQSVMTPEDWAAQDKEWQEENATVLELRLRQSSLNIVYVPMEYMALMYALSVSMESRNADEIVFAETGESWNPTKFEEDAAEEQERQERAAKGRKRSQSA